MIGTRASKRPWQDFDARDDINWNVTPLARLENWPGLIVSRSRKYYCFCKSYNNPYREQANGQETGLLFQYARCYEKKR